MSDPRGQSAAAGPVERPVLLCREDAGVYDGPMLRGSFGRLLAVLTAAAVLGCPLGSSDVRAADDERGRPWARGTITPSFGFGLGLSSDLTQIGLSLGGSYFVWHGLSFGLGLSDRIFVYSSSFKNEFPGVEDQIPTNIFRITPSAQYVFYRSRWFSPYVAAGVGPTFFNHDGGVFGHWVAGPGAYIGVGGPVFLDLGVTFSGMFPVQRCNEAFIYEAPSGASGQVLEGVCSFGWGPRLGLVVSFGGGRSRRRRDRDPPARGRSFEAPPPNPMPTNSEPSTSAPAPLETGSPESAPGPMPPSSEGPTEIGPPPPPEEATESGDSPAAEETEAGPPEDSDSPPPSDVPPPELAPEPDTGPTERASPTSQSGDASGPPAEMPDPP